MIIGLCWNLRLVIEFTYNNIFKDLFWFLLLEDFFFLKIIFFHGEIFEF
jgi:hypothetical protein